MQTKTLLCRFEHLTLTAALGLFIAALAASPVKAELLCDCTQVVDACSASVNFSGTRVNIESSNDSCSRVDYLIEGQPFTALIVGGSDELGWPGQPMRDATVIVENCRVCAETGSEAALGETSPVAGDGDPAKAATDDVEGGLNSLIKVMPQYPRQAWMNKLEGDVVVEFSVNAQGAVQNIKVISSTNAVFDLPAIDAVSRFRYQAADDEDAEMTTGVRERFYFRLLQGGSQPNVSSAAG